MALSSDALRVVQVASREAARRAAAAVRLGQGCPARRRRTVPRRADVGVADLAGVEQLLGHRLDRRPTAVEQRDDTSTHRVSGTLTSAVATAEMMACARWPATIQRDACRQGQDDHENAQGNPLCRAREGGIEYS